jgi:hypothetical protein
LTPPAGFVPVDTEIRIRRALVICDVPVIRDIIVAA